jgi:hypothetical protein
MREDARIFVNGVAFVRRHRRVWLLSILAASFLGAVGAFGSGAAPFVLRYGFWLSVMLAGALIVSISVDLFDDRGWLDTRPALKGAALALAVAAPQTAVVWAVGNWMFDDPWRVGRLLELYPSVLLVTGAFLGLHVVLGREPPLTSANPSGLNPSLFLERLPPRLRSGELYAVQAEDHYLRLHTSRGSALIAMRLADALRELDGIEGAQVHRSWWVARDAVEHGARRRGRAVLSLKGGLTAPVSRTYAPALRRAHWF